MPGPIPPVHGPPNFHAAPVCFITRTGPGYSRASAPLQWQRHNRCPTHWRPVPCHLHPYVCCRLGTWTLSSAGSRSMQLTLRAWASPSSSRSLAKRCASTGNAAGPVQLPSLASSVLLSPTWDTCLADRAARAVQQTNGQQPVRQNPNPNALCAAGPHGHPRSAGQHFIPAEPLLQARLSASHGLLSRRGSTSRWVLYVCCQKGPICSLGAPNTCRPDQC